MSEQVLCKYYSSNWQSRATERKVQWVGFRESGSSSGPHMSGTWHTS